MRTPIEIKHDHYRQLFFDARASRGQVRGSLATPVAATAFTVFNLGTLARSFDASRSTEPVGLALGLLAVASVVLVIAAIYCAVRVEWHFVHLEPPDLAEIARIEDRIQADQPKLEEQRDLRPAVSEELQKLLTGAYYEAYIVGNARSARYRMWALRLVLLALACLAVAFLLLPFQAGTGTSSAAGG